MHVAVSRHQRAEGGGREEERASVMLRLRVESVCASTICSSMHMHMPCRCPTVVNVAPAAMWTEESSSCLMSAGVIVARLADELLRDMGGSNAGVNAAEMQSGVE